MISGKLPRAGTEPSLKVIRDRLIRRRGFITET